MGEVLTEVDRCQDDFAHFADRHCLVEAKEDGVGEWVPFRLWDAQKGAAAAMQHSRRLVVLKARQLGLTWLCVALALWLMLFHPIATVLLLSLRDQEARNLLRRLRGMYARLPDWMRTAADDLPDNVHEWQLPNGSAALALTRAGDSYTASLVVIDEADLIPNLDDLLDSLKPTVADGGRMVLVSRADKDRPESPFKRLYRSARAGGTGWRAVFLPWDARPGRTREWYEREKAEALAKAGNLDGFHGNYPATDTEALAARSANKRIVPAWLEACWQEAGPVEPAGSPALPGLDVFVPPLSGRRYVIGADPAEGNPGSDDSALCVLDAHTGEEVAALAGKLEPSVFASHLAAVADYYQGAGVLCERNNHGHAVLLWLRDHAPHLRRLCGHDGREGWLSSTLGKVKLYDATADAVRNGEVVLHHFGTMTQLQSIEGSTLRAPEGEHDDRADAFALACVARLERVGSYVASRAPATTVVDEAPGGVW